MEPFIATIILVGGLISGFLSGISGGGGNMLMVPLMIACGFTPQQAVATSRLNGIGILGSILAFRKTGHIRKDIIKVMLPIALVIGLITPFIFMQIDGRVMQTIIAIILLVMVPTLFLKTKDLSSIGKKQKGVGYVLYSLILFLQGVFGAGVGALSIFVCTLLLGTTKLEASATRRVINFISIPFTIIVLMITGFIVVGYGVIGMLAFFAGNYVGSKTAIKKGERFATWAMAIITCVSAIFLLFKL